MAANDKVRFIYNPGSGNKRIVNHLSAIKELYTQEGYELEFVETDFSPGAAGRLLDGLEGCRHLLVAGGDGTLNHVVNLLKSRDIDIPLAALPTGTANDFTRILDTPLNLLDACRAILAGEERCVDIGSVNGRYFVNVFSCGLFTDSSQKTPDNLKNTFGKLAYYFSGIGEIPRFRQMDLAIETDGGDYDGKVIIFFVFNGRTAGSIPIAPLSEVDDGLLDVLVVHGRTLLQPIAAALQYLPMKMFHRDEYPKGITHFRCTRLTATSSRDEKTDVDGQPGPSFPLDIRCHKGGLRIIMPRNARKANH